MEIIRAIREAGMQGGKSLHFIEWKSGIALYHFLALYRMDFLSFFLENHSLY